MINTWFKFEDKIQNTSKVIVFTRNDTDDADDDDGTKNNMSLPGRVGGGRHNMSGFKSPDKKRNLESNQPYLAEYL